MSPHNTAIDWSPGCLKKDSLNRSGRRKQMPVPFVFRKKQQKNNSIVLFQRDCGPILVADTGRDTVEDAHMRPAVISLFFISDSRWILFGCTPITRRMIRCLLDAINKPSRRGGLQERSISFNKFRQSPPSKDIHLTMFLPVSDVPSLSLSFSQPLVRDYF